MDRVEVVVDELIELYRQRRTRLWLADVCEVPEDFGPWGGVVWAGAETYLRDWHPPRETLIHRLRARPADTDQTLDTAVEEALQLAREKFAEDLLARHVPGKVVERAKSVLLPRPPLQQWKMH